MNVLMIVEQAIMEIQAQNFALHAESVVKLAEQQVQIVLNANQSLEFLIICVQITALSIAQKVTMED